MPEMDDRRFFRKPTPKEQVLLGDFTANLRLPKRKVGNINPNDPNPGKRSR